MGHVGLFIRVPEDLATQFPPAPEEDTSPRHVTLLYVGDVPEDREEEFISLVKGVASSWGPFKAAFDGLDFFKHVDKARRVFYTRVKFNRDVGALRSTLESKGFEVADSYPLAFNAHSTLDYVDGLDTPYKGPVPNGSWKVEALEIWGLPEGEVEILLAPSPSRVASRWVNR